MLRVMAVCSHDWSPSALNKTSSPDPATYEWPRETTRLTLRFCMTCARSSLRYQRVSSPSVFCRWATSDQGPHRRPRSDHGVIVMYLITNAWTHVPHGRKIFIFCWQHHSVFLLKGPILCQWEKFILFFCLIPWNKYTVFWRSTLIFLWWLIMWLCSTGVQDEPWRSENG